MDAIAIPPVVSMETDSTALAYLFAMTVPAVIAMGIFLYARRHFAAVAIAAVLTVILVAWATAAGPADAVSLEPHGLSGYEIVTAATQASAYTVQSTSAKCSRGKKVLGGGASILGSSGAAVFWSGPARTTGTGSWAAAAQEITPTAGPWSLEVYAICAQVSAARSGE